jgi:hypothetical protein
VIDFLCDVYFRCSEWESELTKLVVRFRFDHTTISDSRYRVSAYWFPSNELWLHEPMSSAMRQFNEVIGLLDFGLTRDQFLNRLRLTCRPIQHTYIPIFRGHWALPCCCALSFSTVNMLSRRFYSPHQLICVTRHSRYFLILFFFCIWI